MTKPNENHITLLAPEQTAQALAVSIRTLRDWTARGLIPARYIGRLPRYDLDEVLAALPRRRREAVVQPQDAV